jgi:hypothetical protein
MLSGGRLKMARIPIERCGTQAKIHGSMDLEVEMERGEPR